MPPTIPDPPAIRSFKNQRAYEAWLSKNHERAPELYLRIFKKDSGKATVTYEQAVEVALCFGWIDGVRKPYDELSFLQRFTPRNAKSIWSKLNRERVERLVRDGRMTAHGLRHVEAAKTDGRWAAAYDGARTMQLPQDLLLAIKAEPKALKTFSTLNKVNLYALAFRVGRAKTDAGRKKSIANLVHMLKSGETPHPNGKAR